MTSQDKFIDWAEKNMPTLHLERSEVSGQFVSPVTGNIFIGWSARDGEVEGLRDSHQQVCDNYNKVSYASEERGKQIDKLRAECEALRKDAALHTNIQRAAAELPGRWCIDISVERHAGWVFLHDGEGCKVELNGKGNLGEQVAEALEMALEMSNGGDHDQH